MAESALLATWEDEYTDDETWCDDQTDDSIRQHGSHASKNFHRSGQKHGNSRENYFHNRAKYNTSFASSDMFSTDDIFFGDVDVTNSMRIGLSVTSLNDRNYKLKRRTSLSSISYLAQALPNESWNLLDEIGDHFRNSEEYSDMAHIFTERVIESPLGKKMDMSMAEEANKGLDIANTRFQSIGEELMRCHASVIQCAKIMQMLKKDVIDLNEAQECQLKVQKDDHTVERERLHGLHEEMMMVSNNSDFARRKLTFIRDASENESVLDAYLRMNEMLTELDTVRKMNKATVEEWSFCTSEAADKMKGNVYRFRNRAEIIAMALQCLSEDHQYMMSVLGGDPPSGVIQLPSMKASTAGLAIQEEVQSVDIEQEAVEQNSSNTNSNQLVTREKPSPPPSDRQPSTASSTSPYKAKNNFNESNSERFRDWYDTDFRVRRDLLKQTIQQLSMNLQLTQL